MPGRQRTKEGVKRPSRVRHDRGLRADGTLRPSAERHRVATDAKRSERRGGHSRVTRLERPFWGIDSEGAGNGEQHELVSLRSRDRVIRSGPPAGEPIPNLGRDGEDGTDSGKHSNAPQRRVPGLVSLTFPVVMAFLASSIPDDVQPVAFKLDYHVAMWCKSLPPEKLAELVDREGRTDREDPNKIRPVSAHGIDFDWLPAHFFWFRSPSGRSFRISDVHRFFGRDFADALKEVGAEDWRVSYVREEEKQRNHRSQKNLWTPMEALRGVRYLAERVVLLEALMTRFREQCVQANIVPGQWEGPGQGATKLLQEWEIKNYLSGVYRP